MSPKYSFVLPAYKATFLREAIDSILNQTYTDFELIIVNDASPEDLTSIVNSYHDERIQYYVNVQNIGGHDLVAQWNYCITYAKGDYLILASDDDVYHSDYLEKMDVLINKYPEVDIFRPRVQCVDSDGKPVNGDTNVEDKLTCEYLSQMDLVYLRCKGDVLSGIPYYIFKRLALLEKGGFLNFPAAWFSDDATIIRLAQNGLVSHGDILFSFRMSGQNISSVLNNYQMLSKKLLATELFYRWFAAQLDAMRIKANDVPEVYYNLREAKLRHMVWLICCSERKAFLLCWYILLRIKTLNMAERFAIYSRVFNMKVLNRKPNCDI